MSFDWNSHTIQHLFPSDVYSSMKDLNKPINIDDVMGIGKK